MQLSSNEGTQRLFVIVSSCGGFVFLGPNTYFKFSLKQADTSTFTPDRGASARRKADLGEN